MRLAIIASLLLLAAADAALAAPPALLGVGQQDRHPIAGFAMPGADDAAVSIATSPERASDGSFREENVTAFDLLTDAEIQAGDDWNSEASDSIEVRKRAMRRRTTFTWYVNGTQVATKRVRIRTCG